MSKSTVTNDMKQKAVIYIHGQGGNVVEAEHYKPLFPDCVVIGFDYKAQTPWEAEREFAEYFDGLEELGYGSIGIIANSIGAFYAMCALADRNISVAYFISPIVDMERIEGVTLDEGHQRYVRQHPINWRVPTHILYGENDNLTSFGTISEFARSTSATLKVMPGGEHWFHTPEQMAFLDVWIISADTDTEQEFTSIYALERKSIITLREMKVVE